MDSTYIGNQTDMNRAQALSANFKLELPERFNERHSFNVTNCTTQLYEDKKKMRGYKLANI